MFKSMSIGSRLVFVSVLTISISLTILVALTATKSFESARVNSDLYLKVIADKNAADMQGFLGATLESANTLAQVIESSYSNGATISKADLIDVLSHVSGEYDAYVGVWAISEKDGFYPDDKAFANAPAHLANGRFGAYVSSVDGKVKIETVEDDYEGDDYYLLSKTHRQPIITEPYMHSVGGKDEMLATISVPVISDGKLIGIVGVDILLSQFQHATDTMKVFNTGYGVLISESGMIVTNPSPQTLS